MADRAILTGYPRHKILHFPNPITVRLRILKILIGLRLLFMDVNSNVHIFQWFRIFEYFTIYVRI